MLKDSTAVRYFLKTHIGPTWKMKQLSGDSGERYYNRIDCPKGNFIFVHYPSSKKGLNDYLNIQALLKKKKFHVPDTYQINKKKGWLLIEDIGDLSLEQYYLKNKNLHYHEKSLNQLYNFQHLLKKRDLKKIFTKDQSFNEMLFTYQQLNIIFPNDKRNKLFSEFQKISQQLFESKLIPSHRDFHSRNLFIHKDEVHIIDFQDAGFYPLYYDLASLLYDSYIPLTTKEQNHLIKYYSKKWNQNFNDQSLRITFFQRGCKAIGSFMSFYNQRGQKTHLQHIHPTLKKLQKHLIQSNQFPNYLSYVKTALSKLNLKGE